MKVIFARKARRDLVELAEWGESRWGRDAADAYALDLLEHCDRLAEMPRIGAPLPDRIGDLRRLVFQSHLIVYLVEDDAIVVVAIPHQSSSPDGYL